MESANVMFYGNCGVTVVSHVTHPIMVHRSQDPTWTITCQSFWFWRSEDQKHFWKCLQVSHGGFIVCCTLYSSFHLQKCAEWLTRGSQLDSLVGATFWPPGTYADPIFRLSMSAVRTSPKAYKLNAGWKNSPNFHLCCFAAEYEIFDCSWGFHPPMDDSSYTLLFFPFQRPSRSFCPVAFWFEVCHYSNVWVGLG